MLENEGRPSITSASAASNVGYEPMLTSSLRRRPSSPGHGLNNLNVSITEHTGRVFSISEMNYSKTFFKWQF